jgi:hypothetical protein
MNLAAMPERTDGPSRAPARSGQESDPVMPRETLELVRAYYGIADAETRKCLLELIRALANIE